MGQMRNMFSLDMINRSVLQNMGRNVGKMVIIFLISHFSFLPCHADNRQARKFIRKGNALFRSDKRQEAQVNYLKAVRADSTDARAVYNLNVPQRVEDGIAGQERHDGEKLQCSG